MRVAIYARVSTARKQERGTIGSQLAVLCDRVSAAGDELVAEFRDDGHSGARLDRPGLDALRDAAEAGLFDGVWCLSPDRLARVYAYCAYEGTSGPGARRSSRDRTRCHAPTRARSLPMT